MSYDTKSAYPLTFTLFEEDRGQSVLGFLRWALPRHSEEALDALIRDGNVITASGACDPAASLTPGSLTVLLDGHPEDPVGEGWEIIWETHDLMAIYKPAQLPVSRTTRNLFGTLISEVRRHTPWRDARLLHRLDSETSGLILLAKYEAADKRWKKRFDRLLQRKIYHAWVWGIPDHSEYDIQLSLSEKSGSAIRSQMYPVQDSAETYLNPKACHTRVRVLERRGDRSLVECELLTGRRHQIRAHLAAIGHPIIGDKIYSHDGVYYLNRMHIPLTDADYRNLGAERQLLQAQEMTLSLRGEEITVTLPDRFTLPSGLAG